MVRLPCQVVPGRIPPLGRVSARAARAIAALTTGSGAANGGPRNVTAESGPLSTDSAAVPAWPGPVPNSAT